MNGPAKKPASSTAMKRPAGATKADLRCKDTSTGHSCDLGVIILC